MPGPAGELIALDGITTEGMFSEAIINEGMFAGGMLAEAMLAEDTDPEGMLDEDIIPDGMLAAGILAEGNPAGMLGRGMVAQGVSIVDIPAEGMTEEASEGMLIEATAEGAVIIEVTDWPAIPEVVGGKRVRLPALSTQDLPSG